MDYDFNKPVLRRGTSSVKWDFHKEMFGYENLLPFFIADSDYATAPQIIKKIIARAEKDGFGYTEADEEYYAAVLNWFSQQHELKLKKEWIVPLCGVVSGMSFILTALTEEHCRVVVQPPVYNPFYIIVESCGKTLMQNPLVCMRDKYTIDFEQLESLFAAGAKAILFCNPHNPVGRVWNKDEIARLVDLCVKYDILLISDEIHCDFALFGNRYTSLLHHTDRYKKIIICTSPGKTFNIAGLHCANIIIPDEKLRAALQAWTDGHFLFEPNIFALEACKAAYTQGAPWAKEQNAHIERNYQLVCDCLSRQLPKATAAPLEGTYLVWLNLQYTGLSSEELVGLLAKNGVAVSGGKVYGARYDGYIRLNIACPRNQLREGMQKICEALQAPA